MAVPFFGDQAFWGEMCRRSGVGPAPVPVERLSVEALLKGLAFLARPEVCGSLKPYKPKKHAVRTKGECKSVTFACIEHCSRGDDAISCDPS